jgi:uncharacterized protein
MAYDLETLADAIVRGNVDLMRAYLVQDGDPCLTERETGTSLLHEAAYYKQLEIVTLLVGAGADVNARDVDQRQPLALALQYPEEGDITLATPDGLSVQQVPPVERDLLVQMQIAKLLLDAGAEVNPPKAKGRVSEAAFYSWKPPLSLAVEAGSLAVVKLLLARGAHVNAEDYFLCTPLMAAAHAGWADIVALLLAKGADASLRDRRGRTALQVSLDEGQDEIAALLSAAQDD